MLTERAVPAVTAVADEASAWYLRSLVTAAAKAGISCDIIDMAADSSPAAIARTEAVLTELSGDPAVHGIILATPLPAGARLAGHREYLAAGGQLHQA